MFPIQASKLKDTELRIHHIEFIHDGKLKESPIEATNLVWARREGRFRYGQSLYAVSIEWNVYRLADGRVIFHKDERSPGQTRKIAVVEYPSVAALCEVLADLFSNDQGHILDHMRKQLLVQHLQHPIKES